MFEKDTGISFTDELVPLLTGDQLLFLGPGVPASGAVVLRPENVEDAAVTMHKLTRYLVEESAARRRSRRSPAAPASRSRRAPASPSPGGWRTTRSCSAPRARR